MTQYWILCRSLTHAQRAAALLERRGYTATLTRAPQGLSPRGCSYAVIIRKRLHDALTLLEGSGIPYGQVFEKQSSGEFQEVRG